MKDNPETKMNEEAINRWTKKDTKNAIENLEFIKKRSLCMGCGKMFDTAVPTAFCEDCIIEIASNAKNYKPETSQPVASEKPDSQALENITRKLNEAGVPVTNPDEGDEFVTDKYGDIFLAGDVDLIDGIAFDCQTGQRKSVLIVATVDSWYVKVEAYCKESGITPEKLIEDHKAYKANFF